MLLSLLSLLSITKGKKGGPCGCRFMSSRLRVACAVQSKGGEGAESRPKLHDGELGTALTTRSCHGHLVLGQEKEEPSVWAEKNREKEIKKKEMKKKEKSLTRGFCVLDLATSVVNSAVLPTKAPTSNLGQHYRKTKTSNRVKEKKGKPAMEKGSFSFLSYRRSRSTRHVPAALHSTSPAGTVCTQGH